LLAYDGVAGIDWSWLALDGAMGKAPLSGEKPGGTPSPGSPARQRAGVADRGKPGTKRTMEDQFGADLAYDRDERAFYFRAPGPLAPPDYRYRYAASRLITPFRL
jgi:hypothetical protein